MDKDYNIAQKLIASDLVEGEMVVGQEIGLKIDQNDCQALVDALTDASAGRIELLDGC